MMLVLTTGRDHWRRPLALAVCVLPLLGAADDKEKELEQVRSKIDALQRDVERDIRRRDSLRADLREAELRVAAASRNLQKIRAERNGVERRRTELKAEQAERRALLARHRDTLAGQLRAAYINGRQEHIKLLLNQQDPATLGRLMVYYSYLSRGRAAEIATVADHLERLRVLEEDLAAQARELDRLARQRAAELETRQQAREERAGLMSELDRRIAARGSELAELQENERMLVALIEELRRTLAEFPVEPRESFVKQKGRLTWPVEGALVSDFGQSRAGGRLKWNGVLVAAERGSEVRALYHGRVAFADWLPGLGLLLVLEHGEGYLSLYGHNETLFKTVGDWVLPGEVIATVGDSGGQARPALYFEIRRGTTPLDPSGWVGKNLAAVR